MVEIKYIQSESGYDNCFGIVFNHISMIYDEDYDMVSFSVAPENMQHKTTIAERMQQLVKTESKNVDVLEFNEYKE